MSLVDATAPTDTFILFCLFIFCSAFYKAENFVAAINAFTAAIVLDDSIPSYPLITV